MWSQTWIPVGPGLQPVHSLTAFKLCSRMNLHSTFCCRAVMILVVLQELIEKLNKGELPKNEYPCMNEPSPTANGNGQSVSARPIPNQPAHSMRSRRTATWARPRHSDDGSSSDSVLRHAYTDFKRMGQRIFVFVIGGATRSELRAVYKLTTKLRREVVLGSSSLDDPQQFIAKLKTLTGEDLTADDITI
eukprot:TRINITY_DN37909_c0_g1_i6.p1 TRINITY_DN37909_c0_g1~~TRINITY_DN37909_c0_g1_i6.p1  ORF type:complete len:190 (+),score=28.54 TRINITY_DN37909_c0_g1_i6:1385-1954(+)